MMQQFVETIKVKNGKALALAYHQARMERTIAHFFPALALTAMPRLEEWVAPKADMDLFKARVVYGEKGVEKVEYAPYAMRQFAHCEWFATIRSVMTIRAWIGRRSTPW